MAKKRGEQQVAERGWVIDEDADYVIETRITRGERVNVEYRDVKLLKNKTVSYQPVKAMIAIRKVGEKEPVWRSTRTSKPPGSVVIRGGAGSLEDRVRKAAGGHVGLFKTFVLPKTVKNKVYLKSLRKQHISSRGIGKLVSPEEPN